MNSKEKFLNKKTAINTLDPSYHFKEGVIKINTNNTFTHELAKFIVAWELATTKQSFLTEAIFEGGKRADIINLDTCEVIEILHTEKEKNLLKKIEEYPLKTIGLKAQKIIDQYLPKYLKQK